MPGRLPLPRSAFRHQDVRPIAGISFISGITIKTCPYCSDQPLTPSLRQTCYCCVDGRGCHLSQRLQLPARTCWLQPQTWAPPHCSAATAAKHSLDVACGPVAANPIYIVVFLTSFFNMRIYIYIYLKIESVSL